MQWKRWMERQTDIKKNRQIDLWVDRYDSQINRQYNRCMKRQTNKKTDRQVDRYDSQTNRQWNR